MTTLELTGDTLRLSFGVLDRLLTFTAKLEVPLAHVDGVGPATPELDSPRIFQMPGVWAPGTIMAGIFINDKGRTLWDVHDIEKSIAIYFNHESFLAAVVEVEDPVAAIAQVTRSLSIYRAR